MCSLKVHQAHLHQPTQEANMKALQTGISLIDNLVLLYATMKIAIAKKNIQITKCAL